MIKNIVLTVLLVSLTNSVSAKNSLATVVIDTLLTYENVTYTVTANENNLHVNISTSDEKTMMSMLKLGVSVFFDIKGKKKQNVYVKYPSEPIIQHQIQQRQQGRSKLSDRSSRSEATSIEEDEANRKKRITDILENDYSQNAEYSYFGDAVDFHILMNTLGISAAFTYNEEEGLLEYDLTLPKSKINTDDNKDLLKLTIGIKTIKEKRERNNKEGIQGNIGGISLDSQQRGGRSGSGQAGGRSGGGQRGQRGGPPNARDQSKTSHVLLNFWFKADS